MNISMKALTERQIDQVHEKTLSLLSKHGISINCEQARKTFLGHGARVDGAKVFIPHEMVEEAIKSAPPKFTLNARNRLKTREIGIGCPLATSPCMGVPALLDEAGCRRPASLGDFCDGLKLAQTSHALDLVCSGSIYSACNNPQDMFGIQMYYTLSMTDMPLIGNSEGEKIASDSVEMARRATGYGDKIFIMAICNSLSPMAWDKTMLEGIRVYAEQGQAINISCCSMAGSTAPINLYGGIVEANAEVLAGLVYAQLVAPGTPVIYGTTSSVMDMKFMSLALGTPEYSLISTGCAQMAARYGLPYRSGGGLTDAKILDAQAGMESALNLIISMNNGVNLMLQSAGVLESYMSVSFDKWVMDEEIIMRVRHMQRGLGEMPEDIGAVIAEGTENGDFLSHESTLENFREELYWPALADRRSYDAWKQSGEDYRQMARNEVNRRLKAYERPRLGPDAQSALDRIAKEILGYVPQL